MKTGIELEFWVVDEEGKLDYAKPVSERVYFASQEFSRSMIEIQTEPHENLDDLFEEAISKTEILSELAKKDGKRIVPLGTPLNSGEVEIYESERFRIEEEVIGSEVRHAGRTAGLHIHFEKEDVLDQLNTLTALDPLTSVINSSPAYQGEKIAKGSRNKIYRNKACGNFPQQRKLWKYVDSVEEWRKKRIEVFDGFRKAAKEKGVDMERFETHFQAENALWNPVKLREDYPTVEWRAPDTTLMTEIVKLLRQVKPLVKDEKQDLPDFTKVKKTSQEAIENGLDSKHVEDYLGKIGVNYSNFNPISHRLDLPEKISKKKACELRLEVAEELSDDLEKAKKMLD